jgi:hypothetical protein
MENWIGYQISSRNKDLIYSNSTTPLAMALYSDFVENRATKQCLLVFQKLKFWSSKIA